jgi:hypothetical protein
VQQDADSATPQDAVDARRTYQRFLIFSGVSLAWAGGGWAAGQAVEDCEYARLGLILGGLFLGTLYLGCVARWAEQREDKRRKANRGTPQ